MANQSRGRSLNFKLWLWFSFFMLILIAVQILIQYGFVKYYQMDAQKGRIRSTGQMIAEDYLRGDFDARYQEHIDELGASLLILDEQGTLLFLTGTYFEHAQTNRYLEYLQSKKNQLTEVLEHHDSGMLLFYGVYQEDDSNNGIYLFLVQYLENSGPGLSKTIGTMLLSGLALFVIAAFVVWIISWATSQPLNKMSKGNLDEIEIKLVHTGVKEIDRIAGILREAKDEVEKTKLLRKDLIANASHDLRTPLTIIKSYAEMIRDISGDDPEKRKKHLDAILRETEVLNVFIENIADLSRAQAGIGYSNDEVFNYSELVQAAVDEVKQNERYQSVHIVSQIEPNLLTFASRASLGLTIIHLIKNACRNLASEEETLFVCLRAERESVLFELRYRGTKMVVGRGNDFWAHYYRKESNEQEELINELYLTIAHETFAQFKIENSQEQSADGTVVYRFQLQKY